MTARQAPPPAPEDVINHPSHYAGFDGGVECIDAIRSALGREQFIGYLRGVALAYAWRTTRKGDDSEDGVKDAKKLAWYGNKLASVLEEID